MAKDVVVFDQWFPGTIGTSSPILKRGLGTVRGVNGQVYRNGSLGIRPGWKLITESGSPGFTAATDTPRGIVWRQDATATPDDYGSVLFIYESGANTYIEEGILGGGADPDIAWGGQLTRTTANFPLLDYAYPQLYSNTKNHWTYYDGVELTIIGGEIFEDFDTAAPTSFHHTYSGSNYASAAAIFRDRAYFFGYANFPGRVYYSDAAAYATVGASSYFDVSSQPALAASGVIGMWSISNTLLIARKDGRWFTLSGANPETGTLREMAEGPVPLPSNSAVVTDDTLWFISPTSGGIVAASPGHIDTDSYSHLTPEAEGLSTQTAYREIQVEQSCGDIETGNMWLPAHRDYSSTSARFQSIARINESWNVEDFDSTGNSTSVNLVNQSVSQGQKGRIFQFTADASDNWDFWCRDYTLDRASSEIDTWSEIMGNDEGAVGQYLLRTPQVESGPGKLIRPVKLWIDFDHWTQTDGAGLNSDSFALASYANVYGIPDINAAEVQSTTYAMSETIPDSSHYTMSERQRQTRTFESLPYGASFDITVHGYAFSIHTISVQVEVIDQPD